MITLRNVTATGNYADLSGGGILLNSTLDMSNSIVAGNKSFHGGAEDVFSDNAFTLISDGHNIFGTAVPGAVDGDRTNVLHLPVRGAGDGGIFTTAADVAAFWTALFSGRIASTERVAEMVRPHSDAPSHEARYGLGFWLAASGDVVELHGYDAGVSFQTAYEPSVRMTTSVLSNTSEGAWPIAEHLDDLFAS